MSPLVGFRAWRVLRDDSLRSVLWDHVWRVGGSTTARCLHPPPLLCLTAERRPHDPPGHECRCGLYARTDPGGVLEEYPLYPNGDSWGRLSAADLWLGAVLMTGEVAWGDKVIRASEARPLCLTEPEILSTPERRSRLEAIASHNHLPLVPWPHLVEYAGEFGDLARA